MCINYTQQTSNKKYFLNVLCFVGLTFNKELCTISHVEHICNNLMPLCVKPVKQRLYYSFCCNVTCNG